MGPRCIQLFASIHSSLQQPHNPLHLELAFSELISGCRFTPGLDWLAANPEVKDDLYARHSRYHLMQYIKKCHVKILKRKERKKGLQIIDKVNMTLTSKIEERERPASLPCNLLNNMPTKSGLKFAKRNEAFRKYEISQVSTLFPKPEGVKFLKNS